MVITGNDKTTRRRSVRRQRDPLSSRFGPELRQAREKAGLSLETVQDRTGIRRFDIEALENGDLSRFPDEKAALIAVRRCAEVLELDAATMTQSVAERWRIAAESPAPALAAVVRPTTGSTPQIVRQSGAVATGAVASGAVASGAVATGALSPGAGHLSRYPGDTSHLKAFTQTAQVPQVAGRAHAPALPPGLRFDSTDAIPVTWRGPRQPDPAPLALRVAVWSTVLLLSLGVVGVAVHHWQPAWLVKIHLVSGAGGPAGTPASSGAGHHGTVPADLVTETTSGPQSATLAVRFPVFDVVVTTRAPCWINVTSPASAKPVFSATVPAGTTKTFTSTNGQLTVELGASGATVTTKVFGQTIPNWSLTPGAAPFVMTFHSAH